MKTIQLQATGEIPTEFVGREINSWTNSHINGRDRNRFHRVTLYQLQFGSFVALVEYVTHWQGEGNHSSIFELDTQEELYQELLEIDPIDHLLGYPTGQVYAEKQSKLKDQITSDWRSLLGQVALSLGIKKKIGKPAHPLGTCSNPGWSIPQQIIDAVDRLAAELQQKPSAIAADILAKALNLS